MSTPTTPSYRIESRYAGWSDWRRTATLIRHLTRRQLVARYRGSSLGFVWSLLNPILMMAVYTFVFQYVFRISAPGVPYPVFFLTGILAWNFLHISTMNSAVCIVDNHALVNKVYFPRVALPCGAVLSNAVNYLVTIPLLLVFNAFFGIMPGPSLLLLPVALLGLLALALALSLLTAAITPFFRDLIQLLELLFLAWFFASPVLYPTTLPQGNLSPAVYAVYRLNPVVGMQSLVRTVFLGQELDVLALASAAGVTIALLALGWWLFHRLAPEFPSVL